MKEEKKCLDCGKIICKKAKRCRVCAAKRGTKKVTKLIPDREKIPEMYQSGLSTVAIAKQVGLSKGAVHSILRCRGVKMRNYVDGIKAMYPDGRKGKLASNWKGGKRHNNGSHRKYYKGELSINWKGGRVVTTKGYIYIYNPDHPNSTKDGYVMEHRLAMEKHLGRFLTCKEVIHHINGIKDDNRIENLELFKGLGQHVAIHFDAVAEVARLKKVIQQLKTKLQKYEQKYGKI